MVRYTVALDHSPDSWAALAWVDQIVDPSADTVRLLLSNTIRGASNTEPTDGSHLAEHRLSQHHPGLPISRYVSRSAGPLAAATCFNGGPDNRPDDVLVVGSALSGRRAAFGRRTHNVSAVPVVVVPARWSASEGPVVVGIDGRTATAALAFAADEAERTNATLVMVRSWSSPTYVSPYGMVYLASDREVWEHESQLELDAAMRSVGLSHPELRVRGELHQGRPEDVLVRAGESARLIVIGRHDRSILQTLVVGSVGRRVMLHSRTPVCVAAPTPAGQRATTGVKRRTRFIGLHRERSER